MGSVEKVPFFQSEKNSVDATLESNNNDQTV